MNSTSRGVRIGLLERRHPPEHRGALVDGLAPLLRARGAQVDVVHAEEGMHRVDRRPPWDVMVLKSGSPAALHVAAAVEGWGIQCVNSTEATRLAQDKLASCTILQRAGLPVAPGSLAWLGGDADHPPQPASLASLAESRVMIKSARGSQGAGLWLAEAGQLPAMSARLPQGPYLIQEHVPHEGDDLKVFVAGAWLAGLERPFPARTYEAKLGRPVGLPGEVAQVSRAVGELLGLTCYGCDFVRGHDRWMLVDVNAFPGYKGAPGAPEAVAAEIIREAQGISL